MDFLKMCPFYMIKNIFGDSYALNENLWYTERVSVTSLIQRYSLKSIVSKLIILHTNIVYSPY